MESATVFKSLQQISTQICIIQAPPKNILFQLALFSLFGFIYFLNIFLSFLKFSFTSSFRFIFLQVVAFWLSEQ